MTMRSLTRLALAVGACAALALGAPGAAAETPPPDPNLDQVVAGDETIGDTLAEASAGHIDVGPKMVDGTWRMMARDDTATPPTWRYPSDFVIRVTDRALLEVPDDPQFDFLKSAQGRPVHVIPQTENRESVWLGWNTQDPAVVPLLPRGAELVLREVEGPGEVFVFLSNGFDPPAELWNSTTLDEGGQAIWIEGNTHVHANWVFTEPGAYLVTAEPAPRRSRRHPRRRGRPRRRPAVPRPPRAIRRRPRRPTRARPRCGSASGPAARSSRSASPGCSSRAARPG
jgi:hypothetical protein